MMAICEIGPVHTKRDEKAIFFMDFGVDLVLAGFFDLFSLNGF